MTISLRSWALSASSVLEEHPDLVPSQVQKVLKSFKEDQSPAHQFAEKVAKIYTTTHGEKAPVVTALIQATMPQQATTLVPMLGSECSLKAAMAMVFATLLAAPELTPDHYEDKISHLRSAVTAHLSNLPTPTSSSSSSSSFLSPDSSNFSSPSLPSSSDQVVPQLMSQMTQLTTLVTQLLSQQRSSGALSLPSPVINEDYWREREAIKTTWKEPSCFSELTKGMMSEAQKNLSSEVYILGVRSQIDAFVALRNRLVQDSLLLPRAEEILTEQFTFLQRHLEAVTQYVVYNDARPKESEKLSKKFPGIYYQALSTHKGSFDAVSLREARKSATSLAGKRFLSHRPSLGHSTPRRRGTPKKDHKSPSLTSSHSSRSKSRSTSREK